MFSTRRLTDESKPANSSERCVLMSVGEIIIAWLLLRQADIAIAKLPTATGKDHDFYTGKVASAKYFIRTVLPHLRSELKIIASEDGEIMNLPEGAY